jgi:MSHA biogenesis protein MshN
MTKTAHPPTPAERADTAYANGMKALHAGNTEKAENDFRAALKADATAYGAREALAALLRRQGHTHQAMHVFTTGMKADPNHRELFTRLYARLLVADNQIDRALSVLRANPPAAAKAPERYAFLAALEERQGDHKSAISDYLKALKVRPDEGRWWAGLGVAYEQSRVPKKALAAFQRARHTGGLNLTLATYVNQRIDALTP